MMEEFTLELVSNASMDIYPNNTLASFTNFLPHEINLRGSWEIALLDICYPARFKNIVDGRVYYYQYFNKTEADRKLLEKENEELKERGVAVKEIEIDPTKEPLWATRIVNVGPAPGFYSSIGAIFEEINNNIERVNRANRPVVEPRTNQRVTEKIEDFYWLEERTVEITHASYSDFSDMCELNYNQDKITDKIRVAVNAPTTSRSKVDYMGRGIEFFGDDICSIVGLVGNSERKTFTNHMPGLSTNPSYYFDLPVDVQRLHTVMMYCNVIQPSIVGDTSVPILRSFPISNRYKKNGEIEFTHVMNFRNFTLPLQFHKLLRNSFHSIQVDLRAQTGEPVPFFGIGVTRATLLFRKISD